MIKIPQTQANQPHSLLNPPQRQAIPANKQNIIKRPLFIPANKQIIIKRPLFIPANKQIIIKRPLFILANKQIIIKRPLFILTNKQNNMKRLFRIFSVLLTIIPAIIAATILTSREEFYILAGVEALLVLTALLLAIFYRRIIKPLQIIASGMELLREQDFSSRLRKVGQADADRIVNMFNRMMEQLKDERRRLREQNRFLDLMIAESQLGVIILDLDGRILSVNPAVLKLLHLNDPADITGRPLALIDSPLITGLLRINSGSSATLRLLDANIYKCTHSTFIDSGFSHTFYLIEPLTDELFLAEKKTSETLIRMIAHEVNNTTAGITSTLDTLERTLVNLGDASEMTTVLRVAIERCYSMNRFITNFADVVRIPSPELRERDLNELVTTGKRFMETICRHRNIKIILRLSETPSLVYIDSVLFEQVLVNIIKNAAESISTASAMISPDEAVLSPDSAVISPDSAVLSPDSAKFSSDVAGLSSDVAGLSFDSAKISPDEAGLSADVAWISPDVAGLSPDESGLSLDSAKISPDSAKISPDSAKISLDEAGISPDVAGISPDYAKISFDEAGISADVAKISFDVAGLSLDSAKISLDEANLSCDGIIYISTFATPKVVLEIADTGAGISGEVSAKLFSPFFSSKPQGQGLGLLFVREVLLRHGCTFSLRTYPDGLTRFRIHFA